MRVFHAILCYINDFWCFCFFCAAVCAAFACFDLILCCYMLANNVILNINNALTSTMVVLGTSKIFKKASRQTKRFGSVFGWVLISFKFR